MQDAVPRGGMPDPGPRRDGGSAYSGAMPDGPMPRGGMPDQGPQRGNTYGTGMQRALPRGDYPGGGQDQPASRRDDVFRKRVAAGRNDDHVR